MPPLAPNPKLKDIVGRIFVSGPLPSTLDWGRGAVGIHNITSPSARSFYMKV